MSELHHSPRVMSPSHTRPRISDRVRSRVPPGCRNLARSAYQTTSKTGPPYCLTAKCYSHGLAGMAGSDRITDFIENYVLCRSTRQPSARHVHGFQPPYGQEGRAEDFGQTTLLHDLRCFDGIYPTPLALLLLRPTIELMVNR